MKIFIRNMASLRCKLFVKAELSRAGIIFGSAELGEVEVSKPLSDAGRDKLQQVFRRAGLKLMDDGKIRLLATEFCFRASPVSSRKITQADKYLTG